ASVEGEARAGIAAVVAGEPVQDEVGAVGSDPEDSAVARVVAGDVARRPAVIGGAVEVPGAITHEAAGEVAAVAAGEAVEDGDGAVGNEPEDGASDRVGAGGSVQVSAAVEDEAGHGKRARAVAAEAVEHVERPVQRQPEDDAQGE